MATDSQEKGSRETKVEKNERKRSNPFKGDENKPSETKDKNGNVKQRRTYRKDGYPDEDIDFGHKHDGHKPHKHIWGRPKDGSIPTIKDRCPGLPL